jgi:uncharacterized protein
MNFNRLILLTAMGLLMVVSLVKGPLPDVAAQYEIKEFTPELKSALDARRARREQLNTLKQQGVIGETNRGYVEVLSPSAEADSVAQDENRDRKVIYETIARQHNLTGEIGTIEKVFAQEQRDRAQSGDKVQDEGGRWTTK